MGENIREDSIALLLGVLGPSRVTDFYRNVKLESVQIRVSKPCYLRSRKGTQNSLDQKRYGSAS
jgi:hypothetical protein